MIFFVVANFLFRAWEKEFFLFRFGLCLLPLAVVQFMYVFVLFIPFTSFRVLCLVNTGYLLLLLLSIKIVKLISVHRVVVDVCLYVWVTEF